MQYPAFCNGTYESQSVIADQERTVNFYYERMESAGASSRSALYPTPGVETIVEAGAGPGRAHFFMDGLEYAVFGTSFNQVGETGGIPSFGTVATDSNPATISSNGDGGGELFITSGSNGYIFNPTTSVFTLIVALQGRATMGGQIDGYFLALDANTSTMYISDLYDGLTWDPTQFAQRSSAPDPWISMQVVGIYIWLFGEQTSEVWYDTGASPFPFAKHPSSNIPYGIAAPFSSAVIDGTILWLGASKTGDAFVLKASGFTAEVASDYATQSIFHDYATISDAQADTLNYKGHSFYQLTFPTVDTTWTYDIREGKWFEWLTWISEDSRYAAWRPRWHAMAFGEHRMLDSSSGAVYRLSETSGVDVDSRPIRRMRRAPSLTAENQRIFFSAFELDLEPGLGLSTGQGSNPQVMLRMSNDGGKTWGAELWRTAGAIGKWGTRVRWNRIGNARRRVFEITVSDPIPWRITDAYLTLAQPLKDVPQQAQAG